MPTPFIPPRDLLSELEPAAERLMNRHLGMAKEWFPHEYIPYSVGRDFDKEPWTPDQPRISGVAQIAFEVNLLTEDNLPSYHREIHRMFGGGDGAWINWVNRWTAEEGRHAIVLRDYLIVTRNIDPIALERGRMQQLQTAYDHDDGGNVLRGIAYVAFQELATRISHRNTGRYSSDPVADEIIDFQMPGVGMANFTRKAAQMAKAGIYDLRVHHDEVIWPLLRHWGIFELPNLSPEAERRREELRVFLERLDATASRFEAKRAATLERQAARAG